MFIVITAYLLLVRICLQCFNTVGLRQEEEHLACKKLTEYCGGGVVVCLERGANDLHMVELMLLPPSHLLLH